MGVPFSTPPHGDLLAFLILFAILLTTARVLGILAQRMGQPAVLGEILAGVILGPSLLAGLVPGLEQWLIPQNATQGHLIESVALLGALFLLFLTGLETDLALIRHQARTAIAVGTGSLVVPFATGYALGMVLPETLVGDGTERVVFALFIATALAISSIAVIGKVLIDMDLMRRDIGQAIIASAVLNDIVGWIILAVVASLASGVALTVGGLTGVLVNTVLFLGASFLLGRLFIGRLFRRMQRGVAAGDMALTVAVVLMLAWAAASSALELEPVLGAFIMGMLVAQATSLPESARETLERMTSAIFAPVFFGLAGLKMDVVALADPELALLTIALIVVSTFGKFAGSLAGARLAGVHDWWRGLSYGSALNARAAMGIIIATVGLSLGIIDQDMFSMLVLVSVLTAVAAPPTLRWAIQRVEIEPSEAARLALEARAGRSWVMGVERVLMPVRFNPDNGGRRPLELHLLERFAAGRRLDITVFTVISEGDREAAREYVHRIAQSLSGHAITRKVVVGSDPAESILREAERGYDLLVLGAPTDLTGAHVVYTQLVDRIVRLVPVPTMVVSGHDRTFDESAPHRIIVPTNGRRSASAAAEVAFALAEDGHADVMVVNVVPEERSLYSQTRGVQVEERHRLAGQQAVDDIVTMGQDWGVQTAGYLLGGENISDAIRAFATEQQASMILIGTDVRVGALRLALGRRVEELIEDAPCPVIVVNAPDRSAGHE
ncbi:MAG: cation:proton antiporter [Chloroflexi bacterium]|nr:cation:proton antiporter [Chloroflexota bacterium]